MSDAAPPHAWINSKSFSPMICVPPFEMSGSVCPAEFISGVTPSGWHKIPGVFVHAS
jgi:hypothetical protein